MIQVSHFATWWRMASRPLLIGGAYLGGFLALEKAALIVQTTAGVSPWHLSAGLSLVLLLVFGRRYWPALIAAFWLSYRLLPPTLPLEWHAHLILAFNFALNYTLGAYVLQRALGVDLRLRQARDVVAFLGVSVAVPLIATAFAAGYVRLFSAVRFTWTDYFNWWIGDAIGIMVVAPLLLVHGIARTRGWIGGVFRRPSRPAAQETSNARRLVSLAAQTISIAVTLAIIFALPDLVGEEIPRLFYLCFVPLVWISFRDGLPGATAALFILNVGAMLSVALFGLRGDSMIEVQFLMLALSLTGLLLGANGMRLKELEDIVNHSPMVVFLWRAESGWPVEFVSENVRQFGYSPEDFTSGRRRFSDIIYSEDRAEVGTEVHKKSEGGQAVHTREYRILTERGDVRWVDDRTWIEAAPGGRITHYRGVLLDVTERKWAEDKSRRSEQLYELLLRNVREYAVFGIGRSAKIVSWNEGAQRILGYLTEEIIDRDFSRFYTESDEAAGKPESDLNAAMRDGSFEAEGERVRKDGSPFWANVVLTALRSERGHLIGFSCVLRDMTEHKRIEDQLRAAKEAAEAASRAKSDFLATISHEIRTPVNEIIGFAGLLLDTGTTPEQRDCATMVKSSANTLLNLLNSILDFAKIEADKMHIEPVRFDLGVVAEEVLEMFRPGAQQKGLELALHYTPGTPHRVVGDPGRIRQVLVSLVDNAIKFTPKGRVAICIDCQGKTDREAEIRIAVEDSGIGIPENKQGLLFEKFTQFDSSTKRKFGGIGLGLAISKRLVDLMGGGIDMTSRVEEGSTFWFTLRLPLDHEESRVTHPKTDPSRWSAIFARCRVLLADDSVTDQKMVVMLLEKLGCRVDVAANGLEAVEMFDKLPKPYDLVFMDCQMPEMDGWEATLEIRKRHPAGKRTPIIAITASSTEEVRQRCRQAGMDDFLGKPAKLDSLAEMIEKWKPSKIKAGG